MKERRADFFIEDDELASSSCQSVEMPQVFLASRQENIKSPGAILLISESLPTKSLKSRVVEAFDFTVEILQEMLPRGTNLIVWVVLYLVAILVVLGGNWLVWEAVASSRILN